MPVIARFRLITAAVLFCAAVSAFGLRPALAAPKASGAARIEPAAFQSSGEYVSTLSADCTTPQSVFYLGDTVCAEAGQFPLAVEPRYRRIQWVAPDGNVADLTNVKVDPHPDKFIIPTAGDFAQVGTWYVRTINWDASVNILAKFIVRNAAYSFADLWINKWGPSFVLPGDRVIYTLTVANPGPDYAKYVEFRADVPENMIFVAVKQSSGPLFECSTPTQGATSGTIVCKGKVLEAGGEAAFSVYYQVNPEARDGSECVVTASTSSYTEELGKVDNYSSYTSIVGDPNSTDSGTSDVEDP